MYELETRWDIQPVRDSINTANDFETPLDEDEEMELAAELLDVASDSELDQFLGKLIQTASQAVGTALRSDTGRALTGVLKDAAKGAVRKSLPVVGGAIGGAAASKLGVDQAVGKKAGARLASAVGGLLGLELEAFGPEDQEFEGARRFVRVAADAAKNAASISPRVPALRAARAAVAHAARRHAPGLSKAATALTSTCHCGRWIRRGNTLILLGV